MTGVCFGWMLAEMFAAGPLPLVAFTPLMFAMWGIWELCTHSTARWRARIAVSLGLASVAYVNQTTLGVALYLMPTWALAAIWSSRRRWISIRRLAWPVVLAALLAVPAIPFYTQVSPGAAAIRYPGPWWTVYSFNNAVWYYNLFLLPVAVAAIWKGPRFVKSLGLLLLISVPIAFSYSYDEGLHNIFYRTRYLYTFWFYLLLVWCATRLLARNFPRWTWKPAITFALVVLLSGYVYQLQAETKLGRMVTKESHAAIHWLNAQDFDGAIATNSYSLSLYVAALTHHKSPWLQLYDPPKAYEDQHRHMVCLVGWQQECDVAEAIAYLDVQYFMADMIWPAVEDEVYEQIPGLSPVYGAVTKYRHDIWGPLAVNRDELLIMGRMWDAPEGVDPLPWAVTALRADWLTPVWQQGQTKIWKVNRD